MKPHKRQLPETRYEELKLSFQKLNHEKPHIYDAYEKWVFRLISDGRTRLSSTMILSLIRSDPSVRSKSGKNVGIDQNLAPFFAKKFTSEYPKHEKVFKVRKRESKDRVPLKNESRAGSRKLKEKVASLERDMNTDIKRSA